MSEQEHRNHREVTPEGDSSIIAELREVNERLLIAGLREQELVEQLRHQLAFTNAITQNIGEGLCALDRNSRITFVNPAAASLLGVPPGELGGHDFHDLVHRDGTGDCALRDALQASTAYRNDDDLFVRSDGTSYPVSYSASPIITDGQVDGMAVTFRDITERKRLEEVQAGLLAHEQIARTAAEAAVQVRTEVLNAVSHDLRQPLTVIKGMAQILTRQAFQLETPVQARLVGGLERIDNSAQKMMAIINELLDVAQLAAGQRLALEQLPTDLVTLLRRVMAEHDRLTSHHLVLEATEDSLVGFWDALRLERVFTNLLSNATKYSPGDRSVLLRLWRDAADPDWAVIEVHDDGIGIPAIDLPHIFDRFHRGSNVASRVSGIGLGLTGVKQIVEQHGGTICISSAEGAGTTVTVRLPGVNRISNAPNQSQPGHANGASPPHQ